MSKEYIFGKCRNTEKVALLDNGKWLPWGEYFQVVMVSMGREMWH